MNKYSKGLSIVELVIASAILALFLTAISFSYTAFLKLASTNLKVVKATFLAEEGIEATRFLRDSDWQNIASLGINEKYYLNFTGSDWETTSDESLIDNIFYRSLLFENVLRDSQGEIVEAGGSVDGGTRKLTVLVSWPSGTATTTKSISTYITNV